MMFCAFAGVIAKAKRINAYLIFIKHSLVEQKSQKKPLQQSKTMLWLS
jgi:hypothetical protein